MYIVADPKETLPVTEQILSPEGEKLLKVLSDSYARGDGYSLEFSAEPDASTFATSCGLDEQGTIKVHLSTELLRRADAEDRLELLGFATLHELGHQRHHSMQKMVTLLILSMTSLSIMEMPDGHALCMT
jgi:hypothetical protein